MALSAGTRLGPYEITAQLGAGGMGEVWCATDTNLGRQVAIKILPDAFAHDPERLARFEREAKTLASLNHPNIAQIYGLEKTDSSRALVMELVEGPTLADRIAQGPIPIDEALAIAKQIAEALEAAHEQGIIHRDLKPPNVKVRDDGTVKVLDFGLAKALEPATAMSPGLSHSPTITTPAMTMAGVILGTAAYMSPEQAKGRPADKRSDIWAFGCVLYEMLTGTRAFDGDDVADTLAAVLRGEPDWNALPGGLSASIAALIKGCVHKDRRQRVGDISTALFILSEQAAAPAGSPAPLIGSPPSRPSKWQQVAWYALAIVAASLLTASAMWMLTRQDSPRVSRLELTTSGPAVLADIPTRRVAVTPDGSRVVYVGGPVGTERGLFVRRLDELEPTHLVDEGDRPFISPDGQWVGFSSTGSLRKVAITGGPSIEIVQIDGGLRGATWGTDGKIIFATNRPTGLLRVSSDGGEIEVLTRPDVAKGEPDHIWPQLLPGGDAVFFTISPAEGSIATSANSQVAVLDLRSPSPSPKILIRGGGDARYVSTGHLVYFAEGALRAVRFDLKRLEINGSAVPVVPALAAIGGNAGDFDVAENGTLVYTPQQEGASAPRTMTWVDRQGKEEAITAEPRAYLYPRLSPEGSRVALDVREGMNDIWVWDLPRRTFTRVTKDPGLDRAPVWTADGRFILYSGAADGIASIYRQRADGTGTPERLTQASTPQFPLSLSPQGTQLIYEEGAGGPFNHDLMVLPLDRQATGASSMAQPQALIKTANGEANGAISPDGQWLAYQSNESGSWDIYVRPFANQNGARTTVSTGGGTEPRWSHDGRELFYISPRNEMMHVRVGTGQTWSSGTPEMLFDARQFFLGSVVANPYFMYDVAKDGRFLMLKAGPGSKPEDTTASLVVVLNWFEDLKRLVPTN